MQLAVDAEKPFMLTVTESHISDPGKPTVAFELRLENDTAGDADDGFRLGISTLASYEIKSI